MEVCSICRRVIPEAGGECQYCASRRAAKTTRRLIGALLAALVALFVATGLLTRVYREQQRERAERYFERGQELTSRGRPQQAIEQLRAARSFARDNLDYRRALALALWESGQRGEAETHFLELRRADPTDGLTNLILARISAARGSKGDAETYYRTAIFGQWPENVRQNRIQTRFELVELLQNSGAKLQAVAELLQLLEEAPEDVDSRLRAGRLLLASGDAEHAAAVFRDMIRNLEGRAETYAALGEAEFAMGNYLSARTAFRRARALAPDDEGVAKRAALADEIVSLDPTLRRLGSAERLRRSRAVLLQTIESLEACVAAHEEPPPAVLSDVLAPARAALETRPRRGETDDVVETNLSLAEQLWNLRPEVCGPGAVPPEPLALLIGKLLR
jgi:tetratricopeptide (TPR) repeat protein